MTDLNQARKEWEAAESVMDRFSGLDASTLSHDARARMDREYQVAKRTLASAQSVYFEFLQRAVEEDYAARLRDSLGTELVLDDDGRFP